MAGFLYYLPGVCGNPTREQLAARGLSYAFDAGGWAGGKCRGPDGGEGYVLADPQRVERIGYLRDEQQWIPAGEAWVGAFRAALPGPEDLGRGEQLDGHWVRLADRRLWLVPVARSYVEEDGELRWCRVLPRALKRTADGHWEPGDVLPRYRALWDLAVRWTDGLEAARMEADADDPRRVILHFDDLVDAAIEALAWNYRIGPAEAELLGLFAFWGGQSPDAVRVLSALVDEATYLAWLKKKATAASPPAGAGTSTAAGAAA